MDPDQPAHPRNLISIHAVRLQSRETDSEQHGFWIHDYVGFVMTRLKCVRVHTD
jgi:hypothetical protein